MTAFAETMQRTISTITAVDWHSLFLKVAYTYIRIVGLPTPMLLCRSVRSVVLVWCVYCPSFVHRRLRDVIVRVDDVISARQRLVLVGGGDSSERRARSPGAVPGRRRVHHHWRRRVGVDAVELLLVSGGTCRTNDRRRVEDRTRRLDHVRRRRRRRHRRGRTVAR